jgi:hypothetical protein
MRSSIAYSAALLAGLSSALPTGINVDVNTNAPVYNENHKAPEDFSPDGKYFPLKNGFPNPSQDAIVDIAKQAHGTLPNGPPPAALSAEGILNLQLVAANEVFEVAYFTELYYNVTNKVPGYDLGYGHDYVSKFQMCWQLSRLRMSNAYLNSSPKC